MKINVKILQGAECNVDVVGGDSVDRLKELVQVHFLVHFILAFKVTYLKTKIGHWLLMYIRQSKLFKN